VALFFVYIQPSNVEIIKIQDQIKEASSINNDVKVEIENRLSRLEKQKNEIPVTDQNKAKQIVPLEKDFDPIAFLGNINNIAALNIPDTKLVGLTYARTGPGQAGMSSAPQAAPVSVNPTTVTSLSNYSTFQVNFSVKTTHENFMNFIRDIERNEQLVDVTSLSFVAGDKGLNTYQVSLAAYLLQ
jgi:hypothetical protein